MEAGEVQRKQVVVWTNGMEAWALPDGARQEIPELAAFLDEMDAARQ
jgi:hypothetical protein